MQTRTKILIPALVIFLNNMGWAVGTSDFSYFPSERINLLNPSKVAVHHDSRVNVDTLARDIVVFPSRVVNPSISVKYERGKDHLKNKTCSIKTELIGTQDNIIRDHLFAVTNYTFSMYSKHLKTNTRKWPVLSLSFPNRDANIGEGTAWIWTPRGEQKITFYGTSIEDVDFDVVAHEVGHSVLHHLRPEFLLSYDKYIQFQVDVLHEAFADCTAILSSLKSVIDRGIFYQELGSLFANSQNMTAMGVTYAEKRSSKYKNYLQGIRENKKDMYAEFFKREDYHNFSQIITKFMYEMFNIYFNIKYLRLNNSYYSSFERFDIDVFLSIFSKSFKQVEISDELLLSFGKIFTKNLIKSFPDQKDVIERYLSQFSDNLGGYLQPPLRTRDSDLSRGDTLSSEESVDNSTSWCVIS